MTKPIWILLAGAMALLPTTSFAITAKFWRGEHHFEITRHGDTFTAAYGNEGYESRNARREMSPEPVVKASYEDGSLIIELANGFKLFLPPFEFDERPISFREKSQFTRFGAFAQEPDGHKFFLVNENSDRSEFKLDRKVEYASLSKAAKAKIKPGAVIIRSASELNPYGPIGVLAVENGSFFNVALDHDRIVHFGYQELPPWAEHVINPMENPPFDRVVEAINYGQEDKEYRVHSVMSVVVPRFAHQRVWYWVVTTTGQVLTIDGENLTAVGVYPNETVDHAIRRMHRESPDARWVNKYVTEGMKEGESMVGKSIDVERLQNSKEVTFSRIMPISECEEALFQSHDSFFKKF